MILLPGQAEAHASETGFVLLLPTDIYSLAGGLTVALTVLVLAFLPVRAAHGAFRPIALLAPPRLDMRYGISCASAALLIWAIWEGWTGSRDPLGNPLPLFVWSGWWIFLVVAQGLIGNHWRFTSPWTGPAAMVAMATGWRAPLHYPRWLGCWPAVLSILGFAIILLADIAPTDPARLAGYVSFYALVTWAGLGLFGPVWLTRAEGLTVLMRAYGRVGLFGRRGPILAFGLPGWQVLPRAAPSLSLAVFMVVLLGTGSFDGLNETFWWIGVLGLNPLEFPGRSAVIEANLTGLLISNLALLAVFAGALWLGERLAGRVRSLTAAVRDFAPSLLPIALGYHIAHYLPVALVEGQYLLKYFGLREAYVTTGFLNTHHTVKAIWLSQAGAVVIGHVLALLLAHAIALKAHEKTGRALLSQAPLAAFMVGYTIFGLWLLASPRGM